MTPLRQRFIEDLQLRNRSPRTIECYVMHLKAYAGHFGQSPDRLGLDHAHRYILYLLNDKKASWSSYNQAVSALRFFYQVTCPTDGVVVRLPYGKRPRLLPAVRSTEEVARFLAAVKGRSVRMLLRTAYACGLRLNEALHLTPQSIDSQRMVLRVRGKGQKDRLVSLSPLLLDELRQYYREVKPGPWLFPGKRSGPALQSRGRCNTKRGERHRRRFSKVQGRVGHVAAHRVAGVIAGAPGAGRRVGKDHRPSRLRRAWPWHRRLLYGPGADRRCRRPRLDRGHPGHPPGPASPGPASRAALP